MQGSKIKSKGLDLFLAEFLWIIFKGSPHRKKNRITRSTIHNQEMMGQIEEFYSNVWPNCKTNGFCPENTFIHAKGLRIAVGHLPGRAREAVDSEKLRAVSWEVRCKEFIFSVSD